MTLLEVGCHVISHLTEQSGNPVSCKRKEGAEHQMKQKSQFEMMNTLVWNSTSQTDRPDFTVCSLSASLESDSIGQLLDSFTWLIPDNMNAQELPYSEVGTGMKH